MEQKLHRSKTNQVIAGVCGGIAETYNIDSTLVRIIFIILALWGGLGIILYIVGMVLMSYEGGEGKITAEEVSKNMESAASDIKNNFKNLKEKQEKNGGKNIGNNEILGLVIVILGLIILLHNFFPVINVRLFWPIMLILFGILLISGRRNK